ETTRALLAQRAVQDDSPLPRSTALQKLAVKWPDDTTRALLAQRAVQDDDEGPRSTALRNLAETWPDETTRALLSERAVEDPHTLVRGVACFALGNMHSEFGRILLTQDLDGFAPYCDPLEPVSRKHIEVAAARAGIRADDIGTQVTLLSAYLGWELTIGASKTS
ncbi:MAG TPA: HEAT repeat domain-containing protein, partial [Longimicrobium sp.]|nr:HEAT repeat domain-containing protein [Longimicrobium sp.]